MAAVREGLALPSWRRGGLSFWYSHCGLRGVKPRSVELTVPHSVIWQQLEKHVLHAVNLRGRETEKALIGQSPPLPPFLTPAPSPSWKQQVGTQV